MVTGLQHTHSFFAYIALITLIISIVNAFMGYSAKRAYTEKDRKISLYGLIAAHIQLVIGFLVYFTSPLGFSNFSGENMKDAYQRLYMLEHPLINIIGLILITYGYSKSKRAADQTQKYKNIYLFYGLGLVLILSRIPWNAWLNLG